MKTLKTRIATRNFVTSNRSVVAIRHNAPIILWPLIGALAAAVLWKILFYDHGVTLGHEAENPLFFLVLPLAGFIYVIFAGIAIGSVFDEYKTISRAVVSHDLETFLVHRDEQLPILLHILIGVPSAVIIGLTMLVSYANPLIGMVSVFAVVDVIVTSWIVSTRLDNFESSIWFRVRIPEEWKTMDVEKYFKGKK